MDVTIDTAPLPQTPQQQDQLHRDQSHQELDNHAARIRASGILARSTHLHSLFEYLYRCHLNGKIPKELEIATEGMGREDSFDVTQDAMVRVYVHKLRRKLDEFYAQYGDDFTHRLHLPKGEYRLVLQASELHSRQLPSHDVQHHELLPHELRNPELESAQPFHTRKINTLLVVALVALVFINLLLVLQGRTFFSEEKDLRNQFIWQPLFADGRPILVVVGDYFIFAESDAHGNVKRLVREFDVNSPKELSDYLQLNPEEAEYKFDIGLSYLPTSTAYGLGNISPILKAPDTSVQVILASQLSADALRNSHIVYIGHLSGLGALHDAVFDASNFAIGQNGFDELVDTKTGETFANSNGIPGEFNSKKNHLAYLAAFNGPTNNRIVVVAGLRDAGLVELTDSITSEAALAELHSHLSELNSHPESSAFEAIYQTSSFGQTTSPATIVSVKLIKP
ncbi:hypothetical protein [Cellvibrio sp. pealriver]|uniref:hypothetical protein n=1 Tax=Cellvibrio sp. pealriver TaxID=1622269 RepID=UPI00066FF9C0|nr:hypothetical protein [Cellvibrio sp. pealriver]